jgi:hypothetical protein
MPRIMVNDIRLEDNTPPLNPIEDSRIFGYSSPEQIK